MSNNKVEEKKASERQQKDETTINAQKKKKIVISADQLNAMAMRLNTEDIDFIDDSKAALLARSTPLANVMLYFLVVFILVGVLWLRLTRLDEVTRAPGKVVPVSQIQIIQNLEGGILSDILVKEGHTVKKGQILARLDDTRFSSQYRQGYAKYLTILASIARLEAGTENKSGIIFPGEVKENPKLILRETGLFESKKRLFNNTLDNLQQRYTLAKHELNITEPLVKQGVMSKIELLRIRREVNVIKARIDSYKDSFHETELSELNRKRADIAVLEENLSILKDRMQRTTVRSPVEGIVNQIYFNTVGGVIESARPIMEIVPLNDQLIVETRVKPSDIGFIKKGQKAKVKITAYDYAIYGGLDAVVTHVGADTSVDRRGNSYYEVTIKTNKNHLGEKEGAFPIMPGMIASVDIITGKKPILNYLLKPILRAKEKAMRER